MAKLSITAAWEETAAFVKREGRLLFPIAFLLMSLPGAILRALAPVTEPGKLPEAGPWLLFVPVLLVASLVGGLAVSSLALRPGASVGEALQVGLRRFLPLLGAALLVGCGAALAMLPVLMLVGVLAAASPAAAPVLAGLLVAILVPFYLFLWVRLILLTPAAAAEPLGPVALVRRSWQLTAGHSLRLLGFLVLVIIVALVTMMAVAAVVGILIAVTVGAPQPGNLAMFLVSIVSALVQAVISGILTAFIARIYVQLSGRGAEVFA
jgi:hypothetical protein